MHKTSLSANINVDVFRAPHAVFQTSEKKPANYVFSVERNANVALTPFIKHFILHTPITILTRYYWSSRLRCATQASSVQSLRQKYKFMSQNLC